MTTSNVSTEVPRSDPELSLYHLLDPEVLANPYPLYPVSYTHLTLPTIYSV